MAYSEITATVAALQHTHHFHREKMFYYQRLFNARFRPRGIPIADLPMEAFYQRMFNIHFLAFTELDRLLTEYCTLADTALTNIAGQDSDNPAPDGV